MEGSRLPRIRGLGAFHSKVHHNWILPAPDNHRLTSFVGFGINLLMRNERRDIDKIARTRFASELETIPPTHARSALDDIKNRFQFSVVMGSGFRAGPDRNRARPEFCRASARVSDGGGSRHTRCLRRVRVEFLAPYNFDAVG